MHVLQHKKNICKLKLKNGSWGRKGLSEATACCAGFRLMESSFFPVQMRALLCSHYTGPGHLPDLTAANYLHFPTARLQPREELPPPTLWAAKVLSVKEAVHTCYSGPCKLHLQQRCIVCAVLHAPCSHTRFPKVAICLSRASAAAAALLWRSTHMYVHKAREGAPEAILRP